MPFCFRVSIPHGTDGRTGKTYNAAYLFERPHNSE